jgi:hypothetical protein
VLHALTTFAASEGEEPSKTAYYIAGVALASFAVIISVIGIRGHENFPPSRGAMRAVMALAAALVLATMASAVLTG